MKILSELKKLFKRRRRIVAKEIDARRKQCIGTVIKNYADGGVLVYFKTGWFAPTWEHSISAGMLVREYVDAPRWNFLVETRKMPHTVYFLPLFSGFYRRYQGEKSLHLTIGFLDFMLSMEARYE